MEKQFNYADFKARALKGLKSGQGFSGQGNVLLPLLKDLLEGALEGELEGHLTNTPTQNRRNGRTSKTIKTEHGTFPLETPRDRNGDFEPVYAIVWLDAMHFKVRENGQVVSKAVYIIIGYNMEGKKDLLGMYISESEGARFWLQVLTEL